MKPLSSAVWWATARTDSTYKFPLLGDIPLLGWLFKTKTKSREKTNLYIFLTPHIVRTQADAAKLYQEKRETMGEVEEGVIKLNEKGRYRDTGLCSCRKQNAGQSITFEAADWLCLKFIPP